MNLPSLQNGIDQAGSPVKLLWKPDTPPVTVPVVPPEIAGWRAEQRAWYDGVAYLELSHHMTDLFVEGPDALRLLSRVGANNFENYAIGQAKQFIVVNEEGLLVQDGILTRLAEDRFNLAGIGTAGTWVRHEVERGDYDVTLTVDPDSAFRGGADPVLFRFQVQGAKAMAFLESVFGGPLPSVKFFHSAEVSLAGTTFRALRHGMTGQPGFEFFGAWEDYAPVREALLAAGEQFGLVQVGGLAYYTAGVVGGWLATPVPAVYTSESTAAFRDFTSLFSYEGQGALQGSFYSDDIEDYYHSPYELGYGRSVAFNHDFIGKDALAAAKDRVHREKVTLVWDADDVTAVFGPERDFFLSYTKDRVEKDARLIGLSEYATYIDPAGAIHSIAVIDREHAEPGTEVELVWGQHPGPGTAPDADLGFARIKATVQPAPYDDYARTSYRTS
jgi:vanillate/3-O-methylgallate O-demethylase